MKGNAILITTHGLIIRERSVFENDKFVDILTKDLGIIEISVKGAKKITSKSSAGTQLFTYSKLCFSKRGNRYFLNSCEPVRSFYSLSSDLEKYALACYFSEIVKYSITSEQHSENVLRLFLNTLHFLSDGSRSINLLKSIFELRFLTEIGLMPDIVACRNCHEYNCDTMYFDIDSSNIICKKCFVNSEKKFEHKHKVTAINETELYSLRYIIFSEYEKLFNFKISDKSEKKICYITEKYLLEKLGRSFKTLDFYKSL